MLNVLLQFLIIILVLQLFSQVESIVLVHIHVDLVDQALEKLMGVVMLVIIEKGISCSKSRDESSMVHDSAVSLGRRHAFEEVMQLVD